MRRGRGRGALKGKAKRANNRDRRKNCATGDTDAKEEKQARLGIAGNYPIAQEAAQPGP